MKISRLAFETAVAAAKDTEVPLLLVGSKGIMTDVVVSPRLEEFDTSVRMEMSMLPVGIKRYGKVITKADTDLEPGYNLVEKDGSWQFMDVNGRVVIVEIVDVEDESDSGLGVDMDDSCEIS